MSEKRPTTTTDSGVPATNDERSLTVGPQGPTALHDHYVVQKMQHFNRERVPERVVHAKGSGAHGLLRDDRGRQPVHQGRPLPAGDADADVRALLDRRRRAGSPDTARDPRGFALKFYTEQGNYDLVGNNTPVFFVRDASKFQDFIHSQKRLPDTGMRSNEMQWDFWTLSPESAHQVTILMSDRGVPRTYRHMNGFGSHTFSWQNAGGEKFWVKYHFKTVQGIENYTEDEAVEMASAGSRRAPPRPAQGDRRRRRAGMEARGPGDAVRGGARLPLQPVRPDQGLAALRLPGDPGRPHGPRPQPRQLLRRGRAGGVLAVEPGAGDRAQPRQDADGTNLQLPRHASASDRSQLRAASDQLAEGRGPLLQLRRADDLHQQGRPAGVRAELEGRPGRRRSRTAPTCPGRSRAASSAATRIRSTATTTTSARPARWCAR